MTMLPIPKGAEVPEGWRVKIREVFPWLVFVTVIDDAGRRSRTSTTRNGVADAIRSLIANSLHISVNESPKKFLSQVDEHAEIQARRVRRRERRKNRNQL